MKVLDLQCTLGHVFEGWFGSEADFVEQHQKSLVHCPLCGDPAVSKKLSAPRLSLSGSREAPPAPSANSSAVTDALQALVKKLVSEATDVGSDFAEEARKMHYGESESRGIRGTVTVDETQALADEGIEVLALPIPIAPKGRLQ